MIERRVTEKIRALDDGRFLLVLSIGLGLAWCVFHYPGFSYYWNNDDMHLIRTYSTAELQGVFLGTWDPDGVETVGFRPFTTVYNDFRFVLFGESPAAQRLFSLFLLISLLWLIGYIAICLGVDRVSIVIAFGILASTKVVMNDVIWVSDGVHILQWVALAALAIASVVRYVARPNRLSRDWAIGSV